MNGWCQPPVLWMALGTTRGFRRNPVGDPGDLAKPIDATRGGREGAPKPVGTAGERPEAPEVRPPGSTVTGKNGWARRVPDPQPEREAGKAPGSLRAAGRSRYRADRETPRSRRASA